MKKILILAANPKGDLRIDREIRDLTSAIERSKNPNEYEVVTRLAVRPSDLHKIFDRHPPHIVHFSGHGEAEAGLVLESDDSGEELITNKALSGLFNLFAKDSECVLLNACTTDIQADAIKQYVPYVIGTSREILDRAAYLFSVGFYTALGNGESIEVCFARGCNAIELKLNNLDLETDIEEVSRKAIVVHGTESSQDQNPLKIILKRNSRLINQDLLKNVPPASPEFAAKIRQEVVRKKYKNKLGDVLDNFGQTIIKRDKPISKFECQQREIFLDKVEKFWIDGFLEPSLCFNPAVDTTEKDFSGQILRPIDKLEVIHFDIDASYNILQRTGIITNEIDDGKTLLILGEPGSGKTIALLRLAKRLIEQTQNNMEKPIPMVFNLSSWGEKRQPLKDWLIEELKDKYQVPKAWSEPWLKDRQLTLLLDGLDEVKAKYRDDCIIAINQFLADRVDTEIVVCSRIEDYDAIEERLSLSSVICIQPFSREQVLDFLKNVDDSLAGLKTVIEKDREIADFARTPLILNMMTWTYHGWSEKECEQQFRVRKDREFNLFESYITKNLSKEDIEEKYSQAKVLFWLSWLAKIMIKESKTIFLIESLHPNFLKIKEKKKYKDDKLCYQAMNFVMGSLIFGIIIYIYDESYFALAFSIIGGLLVLFQKEIVLFGKIGIPHKIEKKDIIKEIFKGFRIAFIPTLIITFILTIIDEPNTTFKEKLVISFAFSVLMGVLFGLLYFINILFVNKKIEFTTEPNQGIWSSRNNSILVGGIAYLLAALTGLLLSSDVQYYIQTAMKNALFMGVFFGLRNGGISCIQHFNLRVILCCRKKISWNYARFLNYATEVRLMKKVGGGYVFYHRMLMEHFAQMEVDK